MRIGRPDKGRARYHRPSFAGRLLVAASVCGITLAPATLQAHTSVQGLGEIASGLLHPLLTPPHLLVLLALGCLLGQRHPFRLGLPVAVFAAGASIGVLITTTGAITGGLTPVLMLLALPLGALVALARPLPPAVCVVLCAAAALVLGLDSGVDPGTLAVPAAKTLAATWVSLLLCVVNVAFYVSLLPPQRWTQTGVRIIGSWLVAISLLMLAFSLRKG